jgi:hypothetical protein
MDAVMENESLTELGDAELEALMAQAAPGLKAALERSYGPEASGSGGGFNSFVDADS